MEDHQVGVSLGQCKRAKRLALDRLHGTYTEQSSKLQDYCNQIMRSNPGSTVRLSLFKSSVDTNSVFQRLYICFNALKEGFAKYCRPVIGLDGCFLKGLTKGQLLVAISRDCNNQMYPLAWALVEVECKDSWTWFVDLLRHDLGSRDGDGLCFITDQQKGLLDAIRQVLPAAEHRCCAMHVYCNWKKKHPGRELKLAFWNCARASPRPQLDAALEAVSLLDKKAGQDLVNCNPKMWSRAFFKEFSKCPAVENNMSECFNACIYEARSMPVISMLEEIRAYVFTRIGNQKGAALAFKECIGPLVRKKLNETITACSKFQTRANHTQQFEVYNLYNRAKTYTVDLKEHTCACRMWQLSGLPCVHACAAMLSMRERPEQYVSSFYSKDSQVALYSHVILPVNGEALWTKLRMDPILLPLDRKMPGRPRTQRKRAVVEQRKKGVHPRVGQKQTCRRCKASGHNVRSCPNADRARTIDEQGIGVYTSESGASYMNMPWISPHVQNLSGGGSQSRPEIGSHVTTQAPWMEINTIPHL